MDTHTHTHTHTMLSTSGLALQMKTTTECPYLEGEGPEQIGAYLRHFGLYESRDLERSRSVLGLSLPVESRWVPIAP